MFQCSHSSVITPGLQIDLVSFCHQQTTIDFARVYEQIRNVCTIQLHIISATIFFHGAYILDSNKVVSDRIKLLKCVVNELDFEQN